MYALYIYIYIYLSLSLSVYIYIYIYISMLCMYDKICMDVCMCVCMCKIDGLGSRHREGAHRAGGKARGVWLGMSTACLGLGRTPI